MTERQTEIRRRLNLPPYLAELSILAAREVREDELGTFKQMADFRNRLALFEGNSGIKVTIPFEQRLSPGFASFVAALRRHNPAAVFIWIRRTEECGLLELADVGEFNFSFPFDFDTNGFVVITTIEGADQLTLDCEIGEDGQRTLEIDIKGTNWTKAGLSSDLNFPT
jgi:hypothetical protein